MASGDVTVRDTELTGECEFSSASGDVALRLKTLPEEGLYDSSASGDVTLDVDDFGQDFTLVMVARNDRGNIRCPFEFTSEIKLRRNYEQKTVERGSGGPQIELETSSGSIVVNN